MKPRGQVFGAVLWSSPWGGCRPTSCGLVAGRPVDVAGWLAEGPAEVLVHHGADVPVEVGEEHASRVQVLGLRRVIFLARAVLLLNRRTREVRERASPADALLRFLHFGIKCQFLKHPIKKRQNVIALTCISYEFLSRHQVTNYLLEFHLYIWVTTCDIFALFIIVQ